MNRKSYSAFIYFLSVSIILSLISCSSRERKADENALRIDKSNIHYTKPVAEKELPIFDPRLAFFEFNKSALTPEAKNALVPTAAFLKQNPGVRLIVEGYCDERGSDDYNMKLGQRRADSVKSFLMKQGIPQARVETVSYGRIMGRGDKEMAQNRRAGFQIVYPRAE